MNTCESAIKIVSYDKRKWLLRLNQNGMEVGTASLKYAFVTHTPPGPEQTPNPMYLCKWNVETPYRSLYPFGTGTVDREVYPWRCGHRNEEKANAIL